MTAPLKSLSAPASMIDRTDRLWYKSAVIYELHVKAFFDSNNDGIGDFAGLIQKLGYLQDLGVTAIWLLPFYPSPLRDDGYDIADYTAINPTYGTMRDFRQFVMAAHARGMRVITELVLNHTSDQHRWFQRARRAKPGSKTRDYYVWSDTDQKYRGTRVIFVDSGATNWTWDPVAKAYYWHRFYAHQPDLNYDNPRVVVEMLRVMRFWLDMGVDGFRLDAVPYLIEREGTNSESLPETHELLKRFRAEIDERYPDRMLLAEANQWPEDTASYFGNGDECHMAFHFPLMPRLYMAIAREDRYPISDIINQTPSIPDNCQWAIFLRNHDELTLEMVTDAERDYLWQTYATDQRARLNLGIRRRLAPLMENDRRKIELLNGLLLSMPGTPVIYYGDELGMGDNFYLGDRDGVRTPMQWSADRNGGFSRVEPQRLYLPPIMDPIYGYEAVNVEAQQKHANSLLNWTRRMIGVRQAHKAFGCGSLTFLYPRNRKVLAYLREYDGEVMLCVFNLSRSAQAVELDLGQYRGRTPVELTGRSAFPPVAGHSYVLTLPAYGFYWFTLAEETALPTWHGPAPEPLPELETLVLGSGWSLIEAQRTDQRASHFVRRLLPAYLHNQRWFAGIEPDIAAVAPVRLAELPNPGGDNFLLLALDMEAAGGGTQRYFLPLAFEWGEQHYRSDNPNLPYVLAKIRRGARSGVLQEAAVTPDFLCALLAAMRNELTLGTPESTVRFEASDALKTMEIPEEASVERLTADQSGTAVMLGRSATIKLCRKVQSGPHPEIELGRFFSQTGFKNTPAYLGCAEHVGEGEGPAPLAIAFAHVHNQGDGWSVIVHALDRELEEFALAHRAPAELGSGIAYSLALIETIGRRTAELHLALASRPDLPDFAPEKVTARDLSRWKEAARARLDEALDLLTRLRPSLEGSEVAVAAEALRLSRDALVAKIDASLPKQPRGQKMRLHGNYHLERILVAEDDIYIADFGGEPDKSLAERRAKSPASRDLAGMLRSFDYAAQTALDQQRQRGVSQLAEVEALALEWRKVAERTFLNFYADTLAEAKGARIDDGLLSLFLADRLFYEIVYEAQNRPHLLAIPLRAAVSLLQEGKETA